MHCTLTSRTALKPLELISKKMKKLIIFLLLANFIACKQNTNSIDKKTEKEEFTVTNSEKEEFTVTNSKKEISFDDLEEVSLPFCIKGSYVKDDLYYVDIDKFLGFHKLKKSLNKEVNALFHKGTIDFITNEEVLIAYPYYQESEDSPPFAVKKIQINDSITAVLYGYIRVNEYSVPRIELQTFDKQGNYIDSIILYYRLADECSSERTFCIDKNFKIKIQTEFGCTAIEKDDEDFNFEQTDTFKITETGKIVKQ